MILQEAAFRCKQWQEHFKEVPHEPANGDEPLDYCYCSSMGPHTVPHFSGHEPAARDMEQEIDRRGLRDRYDEILAAQQGAMNPDGTIDYKRMRYVTYENRCIAALASVGSRYVVHDDPSEEP